MFYFHWQYWDNQSQVPHFHHDVTKKYAKMNFRIVIYFNCRKMADGKFERKYQQFFWLELKPNISNIVTTFWLFCLGTLTITEGLQNIRDYLDQDGAILSGHQEFITYFALPFVSEPHIHPSFKHLFEVWKIIFFNKP